MSGILLQELRAAALAVSPIDFRRVKELGVINPGVINLGLRHHQFGLASISDDGGGQFVPNPDGQRSLIVPVYEDEQLVDLVAFQTATPEHWLLRLGIGWALGLEDGLERYRWGDPLPMHRTPLDWLRAGCDGLCVIDWEAPEVMTLADLPTLLIPDDALERRTVAALTRPSRLPRIEKDMPLAA